MHTPAPTKLYFPAKQAVASGDVDPAGHAYPALQGPVQAGEMSPDVDPYLRDKAQGLMEGGGVRGGG